MTNQQKMNKATFGAGCFWGVEEVFRKIEGVTLTKVGYMGGKINKPTYEQVCGGETGHIEVVYLEYDDSKVSYESLLKTFWENHDPTTLNRQGPDVGFQYRSVVFYYTEEQKNKAEEIKKEQQKNFSQPIVTGIIPAETFYLAEDYHQRYLEKRGINVCH